MVILDLSIVSSSVGPFDVILLLRITLPLSVVLILFDFVLFGFCEEEGELEGTLLVDLVVLL